MSATTKDKLEFAFAMGRHSEATLWDCQRLLRLGATHKRFAEEACNRDLTPEELRKYTRVGRKIGELCKGFHAAVQFQHDPRGATVKVQVKDGYSNSFGGDGICVPTS